MIPAWSDQALQAIAPACCPRPPASCSSPTSACPAASRAASCSSNGVNKDAALKLADFILTEEIQSPVLTELGGFPGVSWDYVSAGPAREVQGRHPDHDPGLPGRRLGEVAINDGWYRNVAPNVDRSHVTLAPASDIAGKPQRQVADRPPARRRRRCSWSCWMIIWPIVSAITRTVWLPDAGRRPALLARDLRLLLLRPLQPQQPRPSRSGPPASAPPSSCRSACRSRSTCASPTGRLAAYVQGLAIFPMFVPSIILSYALIRVLGPERHRRPAAQRRRPAEDPLALPHALGAGDRPRLGQHPADRADPALRPRRRLQPVDRGGARRRRRPLGGALAHHPAAHLATRSSSRSASPCSASSRPSPCPTCSAPPRPR